MEWQVADMYATVNKHSTADSKPNTPDELGYSFEVI